MKERLLDCLSEACFIFFFILQNKLETVEVGDVVIVNVDHSCAIKNIPEGGRKVGYNVEVEEIDEGEWNIFVEKTK